MDGKNRADNAYGRIIGIASAQNAAGRAFGLLLIYSPGWKLAGWKLFTALFWEQFVLNLKASNHRTDILYWMRFYSLKYNPFIIAIHPDFLLRA